MTEPFKPILYLKYGCPHCFKLRLFLLEAGRLGGFEVREFTPGDELEAAIKAELAPHFEKVTFPSVQAEPGTYRNESDALVAHYAEEFDVEPAALPLFQAYAGRLQPRLRALADENKALKTSLAEAKAS
jgi:hypothetical protein